MAERDSESCGVVFDVDGTLVDTAYLHTVAWWEALRQHGHIVPMAHIHRGIGMGSDTILDHLLGDGRDVQDDQSMIDAHRQRYRRHFGNLEALPGAADLLRTCSEMGLRVVLASSAAKDELSELRKALGADDVISAATSSADAETSKPAPDIVQAALSQGDLDPAACVFVGDSVWDVQASSKLEIPCIGVASGGLAQAELADCGAVATYEGPQHLLDDLDTSPIAALLRRCH